MEYDGKGEKGQAGIGSNYSEFISCQLSQCTQKTKKNTSNSQSSRRFRLTTSEIDEFMAYKMVLQLATKATVLSHYRAKSTIARR